MGESISFSVEYKTPFGRKELFWNLIQSQYYSKCTTTVPPIIQDLL
jgi:hypothetical protein